ncbi:hypothetical protein [Amycolatopsis suaedae]|uniref:DUF998 domain-containing protein n=1 Tax=Amycolatopsis suaedae TaxID=2510978 RepID=A0A4Q7IZ87_9PSEU|nr:hypothetical protein [Amycolatopsis suaedae]RZQ59592.1 hypothetical protein EWH70_33965 [Amycolatopsis suaedae]
MSELTATRRVTRLAPVAGLFLLAPFCAELLSQYQGPITDPLKALLGLLLTAPLYGTAALLIREITRRTGRGWPTILALGAAFGLIQAGLIDQMLFNHSAFGGGPYWQELPTFVPGLGLDVSQLLVFVGGHMVVSFAAPIAVVEACVPDRADEPWLGRAGLTVVTVLYLAGAAYYLYELVIKPGFHATAWQLLATAAAVVLLGAAGLLTTRLTAAPDGRAPKPVIVACATAIGLLGHILLREPGPGGWAWPGVTLSVVVLAALGALLLHWSLRPGWSSAHVLAAASPALLVYALVAFALPADESAVLKYTSNAITLLAVLGLILFAYRRARMAT